MSGLKNLSPRTRQRASIAAILVATLIGVGLLLASRSTYEAAGAAPTTSTSTPGSVEVTTTTEDLDDGSAGGSDSSPIWTGDVETGDVSQWRSVSISGKADIQIADVPTHSGAYSARLINWDVDGSHNAGARLNLQGPFGDDPANLPDRAYYSTWVLIPFVFEGDSNFFQFKQSDITAWDEGGEPTEHVRRMVWNLGLDWDPSEGTYGLEVRTRINQETGEWQPEPMQVADLDVDIPINEWFHVEAEYVWGQDGAGAITVWLDGTEIYRTTASTEASNLVCLHRCREWVLSHYLSDYQGYVAPGNSWLYIDDAALAESRLGVDE